MRRRPLRVLLHCDLASKGIPWSRQHTNRKIKASEFPAPDGKTSDSPSAPNFWFEETIDDWIRARAKAHSAKRTATA
jgi:hypothetical protein